MPMKARTVLFAFGLIGIITCVTVAQEPQQTKTKTIHGKLQGYDGARGIIRVSKGNGNLTFLVAKDVKLTINDEPTNKKLADIELDTHLELALSSDKSSVIAINAEGPEVKRTVESVDLDKRIIKVRLGKTVDEFMLDPQVVITRMKKEVKLDEIKPGMAINIQLTLDKTKVMSIVIATIQPK